MTNFRVVIMDYPKLSLSSSTTKRVLSDLIQAKQLVYQTTFENYVSMSALDMVSTHICLYDTTNLLDPKLVGSIRICYQSRADKHKLPVPIDDYKHLLSERTHREIALFRKEKKDFIDVGALFVDPHYSFSRTGLKIPDILFFFTALFILRKGESHLIGSGNERLKATRWVQPVGEFYHTANFVHPKVPDPHMLVMIREFNLDWVKNHLLNSYGPLVHSAQEVFPESVPNESIMSVEEVLESMTPKVPAALRRTG